MCYRATWPNSHRIIPAVDKSRSFRIHAASHCESWQCATPTSKRTVSRKEDSADWHYSWVLESMTREISAIVGCNLCVAFQFQIYQKLTRLRCCYEIYMRTPPVVCQIPSSLWSITSFRTGNDTDKVTQFLTIDQNWRSNEMKGERLKLFLKLY